MRKVLKISIPLLLLTLGLFISQASLAQSFNFQKISIQEGLPQSQAYAILFDSTQHAWIGTQGGGLCRYDGRDFQYFTKQDSLISNRVFSLKQIDNKIWVGQKGGISVFNLNGGFLVNYRSPNPNTIVNDIVQFKDQIYLATDAGILFLNKQKINEYSKNITLKNQNAYAFFKDSDELWICTEQGLLHFEEPLTKINKARGLSNNQVMCVKKYGDYWVIGTYGGGVNVYSPVEGMLKLNPFENLKEHIILSLFVAKNGELWIGTLNNGVYVYSRKDGSLKNYQSSNGLSNNHVRAIEADLWQNIWIGTSGGGVSIFQNSPFVKYNTSTGLSGNYIYSVLNAGPNGLWVGSEGAPITRLNDTSSVLFDDEFGFNSEKVKALFQDGSGDIWIGTEGQGLGVFSLYDGKDTIYSFSNSDGMSSNWIKAFAQKDKNSDVYIGTGGGGVMRITKTWEFPVKASFKKVKPDNKSMPDRISSLNFFEDQLWFTSPSGEYGYLKDNMASSKTLNGVVFRNCTGYNDKRWLGSSDNGVLFISMLDDSIESESWINAENGLSSNNIYQLTYQNNSLWVGTEKGLDQVNFDSTYNISSIEHFGYEEGFEGLETNINATDLDSDGNLWFGTVNGLFLYQGGEVNYNQRKPPVLQLMDFSIFYESIDSTEFRDYFENGVMIKDLVLPYDKNHIGFSFKAIHYAYSKNIRYRWMLKGADRDWTPPSKNTNATYSNLSPGSYVFMVQADIDGTWNGETKEIAFKIDQPYYEKFWFKAGYYCLIILVLLIVTLIIIYRIKKKNKSLKEKFELEKNLIELEQKALRLQMNPHFIFNVLNSIHNLIILNDSDKARYALSKFSKLMRRVLENSREKYISIDDEVETLENYIQLEKLTSNLDLELLIELDEKIDGAEELLPPLMIQPFVENAIIHGLKELNYQGKITVGFNLINDHLLECWVEDNGRGRKKASEIKAQKENYHKSTALQVTQERLANLNKKGGFVPFEIIDLQSDDGKPQGTKVIFRLEI